MGPSGFCIELHAVDAQMSYGTLDDAEVDAVVCRVDGLFMFSSRLHMMCVMASGASWSLEL